MAGELGRLLDGIPIVADATTRELRFPSASRVQNQRVHNLATGAIEWWTGSSWLPIFSSTYDIRRYGAVMNGITDDLVAIQAALDASLYVYVPSGTTIINNTATRLHLRSGHVIFGPGTIKRMDDNHGIFEAIGTQNSHISNITITGITFQSFAVVQTSNAGDQMTGAIRAAYVDDLTVRNCKAINIQLIAVAFSDEATSGTSLYTNIAAIYPTITDTNMNQRVRIVDNYLYTSTAADPGSQGNLWPIFLMFCNDFEVSRNHIVNFRCGPGFAGGVSSNGTYINTDANLKCHTGLVADNILDVRNVATFSWNTRNVLFTGNTIVGGASEGFDSEGCANLTYSANKIVAWSGMCFALYFDNRNVVIANNDVEADISTNAGALFILNTTVGTHFESLIVKGNTFRATGTAANFTVAAFSFDSIIALFFEDNVIRNGAVLSAGKHGVIEMNRNTWINNATPMYSPGGIGQLNGGQIGFASPMLISSVAQRAYFSFCGNIMRAESGTLVMSSVVFGSCTVACDIFFKHNRIHDSYSPFLMRSADVATVVAGSVLHSLTVQDNIFDTTHDFGLITDASYALTAAKMTLVWKNNTISTGVDCYNAIPSMLYAYFTEGSEIRLQAAPATYTQGLVCTVAGTTGGGSPPTWKVFGVVDTASGTWTPVATNLTTSGSPTLNGTFVKEGKKVYCELVIVPGTNTASTANSTYFTGLPFTAVKRSVCSAVTSTIISLGNGLVDSVTNRVYPPSWSASTDNILITFSYEV